MKCQISPIIVSCVLLILTTCSAKTDIATGLSFAPRHRQLEVAGVGVRKKGPIKVYSVAMYASASLKERLSALSSTVDKVKAMATLATAKDDGDVSFLLKMNMKVGAEKMASAIADSVAPRYKGDAEDVAKLKGLIFNGVQAKGAATKGTSFLFDCNDTGVAVAVDGKAQGSVESAGLSKAFCDVYLDDKGVSPKLKESCISGWCLP